ncbi:MAG TPA: hypothetical protein VKG43_02770, partial [Acidimicrobiales bacterium]|nr:hypothetical protein [Acidimicrobiales bacterium]
GNDVIVTLGSSFTGVRGGEVGTSPSAGSAGSTTTTTTVPPPPGDVYTNTEPEPWNPTPCSL